MAIAVVMPKLGLTMQEGTVTSWLVASATPVSTGVAVLAISTDKIETEIEVEADGVLHHAAAEGAAVACGEVVAWLCEPDEVPPATAPGAAPVAAVVDVDDQPSAGAATVAPAGNGERLFVSPNARRVAADLGVDVHRIAGSGPGGRIVSEDVVAGAGAPRVTALISPVARRLAERLGLDASTISGTGPGGRVMLDDVIAVGETAPAVPHAALVTAATEVVPMTGMRGVIAERMHASLAEMAQLTMTADATVDRLIKLRKALREEWGDDAPGYTEFVLAAVARALRAHPRVNATIRGNEIHVLPGVHVGVAIAVDNGLMVPVLRDTDRLSLMELTAESRRLATAARTGKLSLDDLEGGTFSVTTLGAYGVDTFTPVINPPNVAILGVGRIRDDVRWKSTKKARRRRVLPLS
ncbi:MAG: 2-oxo acid dehydrogenase subunit E2, partial [Acidimicrobiia bacterium]|nr:2-oxo acid dehydrogenase subunit E2 [Acidimicrobiia bacterium]